MATETEGGRSENKSASGKELRKKWVPGIKTMFASTGDVIGDWVFYGMVMRRDGLDQYHIPILVFAIIASIFGTLTIVGIFMKNCSSDNTNSASKKKATSAISIFLACEMILEDLPQLVLTTLVTRDIKGGLSGAAIFNLTTSAFNFVFNLLDLLVPLDDETADSNDDGESDEAFQEDEVFEAQIN